MRLNQGAAVRLFRNASDSFFDFIEINRFGRRLFKLGRWGMAGVAILVVGKFTAGQLLSFTLGDLLFIIAACITFMVVAWRWEIGVVLVPITTCFIFEAGVVPTLSLYHFVPEIAWLENFRLLLGQGIMLFMLALVFVAGNARVTRERLTTPMTIAVLSFLLVILVTAVSGVVFSDVHVPYMVEQARPFSFYLMFFVTLLCVRSDKSLRGMLLVIAAMSLIVGVGMALQFFTGDRVRIFIGDFRLESFGRFAGRVLPPGQALVWLAIPMLVSVAAVVHRSLRAWLVVALSASTIGLLLTFTRAMWVGTLAGIVLMMIVGTGVERSGLRRITLAFVAAITVILLGLGTLSTDSEDYMGAYIGRFTSLFYGDTYADASTFGARVHEIGAAWEQIVKHPWFGIGIGNYYTFDLQWDQATFSHVWRGVSYIHNVYVNILCKAGILGLATLLSMCFTFIARGIRIHRQLSNPVDAAIALGAVGTTISCMVGSLMQPSLAAEGPVTLIGIAWGVTEFLRWGSESRASTQQRFTV